MSNFNFNTINLIKQGIGEEVETSFHEYLAMLCAPGGVWMAGLLTTKNSSLFLLEFSGLLLILALIIVFILSGKSRDYWEMDTKRMLRISQNISLVIIASGLAIAALCIGINRISAIFNYGFWLRAEIVYQMAAAFIFLMALLSAILVVRTKSSQYLEKLLSRALLIFQASFPLFFLVLIPTPWIQGDKVIVGYPISSAGYLVILSLIAAAYIELYKRYKLSNASAPCKPLELFSTICVVAVLLFFKSAPVTEPSISADDYHFGEMLVPWWSLAEKHMIPFWDYSPVRGLVNYLPGAVNSFIFDGSVSSFSGGAPYIYTALLLLAVPIFRWCVGLGITILAFLLMSGPNSFAEIDILVTVYLCISIQGFLKWRPTLWIPVWLLMNIAILLYAPGQGMLAILATSPLGLHTSYQLYTKEPKALFKIFWIFAAVLIVAALSTPIIKMGYGAVRYGFEQSNVNSIAHGISWKNSFGSADTNPWLFEIVRASWLFVSLWAGVLLLQARLPNYAITRVRVFAYAIPILIITLLFTVRAAGRIDPGMHRLGVASIWALSLLLPLLLFATQKHKSSGIAVLLWLTVTGTVYPHFGGFGTYLAYMFDPIRVSVGFPSSGNSALVGMQELGKANMEPSHLAQILAIRKVLDRVLDPHETYLDMTNRHANYFYTNRKPPIESGSTYNLVTSAQQLRAISSLKKNPPPAILISADNILHDGSSVSLRSNLLYRAVLLSQGYKVVKIGSLIWLLQADRVKRTAGMDVRSISEVDDLSSNVIHEIFRAPDLRSIPASWGRSFSTLDSKMHKVHVLDDVIPSNINSVVRKSNGFYRVIGDDPFIAFDIAKFDLKGRDAGIISFDFSCENAVGTPAIEIYWSSLNNVESELTVVRLEARNGRLIVPMDAMPAWLLASHVLSVRFDVQNRASCEAFKFENIKFLQRNSAE